MAIAYPTSSGNTIMVLLQYVKANFMRVTTKGQVTIPRKVREVLGITPETEIDFIEDNGRFYIVKTNEPKATRKFKKLRGIATAKLSTDEIMSLTRDR